VREVLDVAKVSKWSERLFGTPLFEPLVAFSYLFPLFYLVVFLIVPVLAMLLIAFSYNGMPSFHWFKSILSSSYYVQIPPHGDFLSKQITATGDTIYLLRGVDFGVIINSLLVSTLVTIMASLVGTIFAFIMARYDFRGKNFFRIALFIPLLVTPFVNAYVIKKMFLEYGLVNFIFHDILHLISFRLKIDGLAGVAIAQAMAYYPIVYLNAYASFINIDPTLEEQAENLGSGGLHLFRTVTFPLALPGIAAGATLVFIFSLEDLAAPIVFQGDPLAKKLMSFQIYSKFMGQFGERSPEIAALSIIMLTLAILAFLGIRKYVSLRQYAMISKGGRWKPRVSKPKTWQALIIYLILLPMLLFTIFPQIGVVLLSFAKQWSVTVFPHGFTTEWVRDMVTKPEARSAIINSLMYSGAAVIMIILLSVTSSYAAGRFKGALSPILESIVILPMAVPGIVIAMGYFYLFSGLFPNTPLDPISIDFNPAFVLILAYSIRRLPFAARSVFAGLQQVHVSLEEASMNLGASRWGTISRVLLPLISLNVFGGSMLSFVYSMSETSTSITLGALVTSRQPMTSYMADIMMSAAGSVNIAASLGLLLIIAQITAIILVNVITKQKYAFIGLT